MIQTIQIQLELLPNNRQVTVTIKRKCQLGPAAEEAHFGGQRFTLDPGSALLLRLQEQVGNAIQIAANAIEQQRKENARQTTSTA